MFQPVLPRACSLGCAALALSAFTVSVQATQPPRTTDPQRRAAFAPRALTQYETILRYNTSRGLTGLVRRARENATVKRSLGPALGPAITLPTAVQGTRAIPVLMATFADTSANPYPVANLQKELFDGPWPTGTMTDYYKEISYGRFTVTGKVFDWAKLGENAAFYSGPAGCFGVFCPSNYANFAKFIEGTLKANDASIDFAQYDNDGPDNIPNSGDDDGYVDFVALVHPRAGGECGGSNNIWSHRWAYSNLTGGTDFETNDTAKSGFKIRIDDYVVMPAFACDGTTMIQIGVFAHEFGHAFGLPDLYDTDADNGTSEGVGGWDLMGAGSWGGDGQSHPETPSHMSAWSKEYLGWVNSTDVDANAMNVKLPSAAAHSSAIKIDIDEDRAYLIEFRNQERFDSSLPGPGLLVWRIKNSVITTGLTNNQVNADETNQGISVVEADGRTDLNDTANRADAGDVFPGEAGNTKFDSGTTPTSTGGIALCNIRLNDGFVTLDILKPQQRCPD